MHIGVPLSLDRTLILGPKNQRVIFSPRSVHGSVHVGDSIPILIRKLVFRYVQVGMKMTNVEHEAEKRAEQEKLEKRIGLLNYLVDSDSESVVMAVIFYIAVFVIITSKCSLRLHLLRCVH